MKDLRLKKLKGSKFNKRICWKNTDGKDRRIDFEKMPFFYIIPKLGFRCENKKIAIYNIWLVVLGNFFLS